MGPLDGEKKLQVNRKNKKSFKIIEKELYHKLWDYSL